MALHLYRVLVGNISTACISLLMSAYTEHVLWTPKLTHVKVVAAFITLYFQRRDQQRAVMSEIRTPGDVMDYDGHESKKGVDTKGRAEERVP